MKYNPIIMLVSVKNNTFDRPSKTINISAYFPTYCLPKKMEKTLKTNKNRLINSIVYICQVTLDF